MCTVKVNVPRGGLPRQSLASLTDHPDMTLAVDSTCKAQYKQTNFYPMSFDFFVIIRNKDRSSSHLQVP